LANDEEEKMVTNRKEVSFLNGMRLWLVAVIFLASVVVAGRSEAVEGMSNAPKTPASSSMATTAIVSDTGKTTISSLRVKYAKKGATRREQGPVSEFSVQSLKVTNEKESDSDALLLFFEIKGEWLWVDPSCALLAENGTQYKAFGFSVLKPKTPKDKIDITLTDVPGALGVYIPPVSNNVEAVVMAFRLPPASQRLTVKGLKDFSRIKIDLK
jgi:hypothetical protein